MFGIALRLAKAFTRLAKSSKLLPALSVARTSASAMARWSSTLATRGATVLNKLSGKIGLPPGSVARRRLAQVLNFGLAGYTAYDIYSYFSDSEPTSWDSPKDVDDEDNSHASLALRLTESALGLFDVRRLINSLALSRFLFLGYADRTFFKLLSMALDPRPTPLEGGNVEALARMLASSVPEDWKDDKVDSAITSILEDDDVSEEEISFLVNDKLLGNNILWDNAMMTEHFPVLKNIESSTDYSFHDRLGMAGVYAGSWSDSTLIALIKSSLGAGTPEISRFIGSCIMSMDPKSLDFLRSRLSGVRSSGFVSEMFSLNARAAFSRYELDRALRISISSYINQN